MARDVFSLAHFPMLCGVIAYAVALEEAIAHPGDPFPTWARLALSLGLLLFVGGTALAMWRATCGRPIVRVGVIVVTSGAVFAMSTSPAYISLAGLDERRATRAAG
jgi:low temperature requirement protein LtrA